MKIEKRDALRDKKFFARNSLLTDLFENPHIRTVYNMFIVTFILLLINTVISDIMESGTIRVGTNTFRLGFPKFSSCVCIWLFMQASTLGVYVPFTLWAYQRQRFLPKSFIQKFWDYSWLSAFILYQILFLVFPMRIALDVDLYMCCALIIIMEQLRMMMKSHAFVRSVAPRFLSYKPHSETPRPSGPRFSQYLYFLFAPTLVYRDEYPRTKKIRWTVVIWKFTEVGLAMFYLAFIFEHFVAPVSHVFGTQHLDWKWYIRNIIEFSIPGILYFLTAQYLLLHSWMNAWAEMLRFADRLFYKDWWNSTTYHEYYRTWNLVVHDWLYTYIYKDMYEIVVPGNRLLSAAAVFLASAIGHEYMFAFSLRFFYPVMFVLFGVLGFGMFFVRKIVNSNVLMWLGWSLGMGRTIRWMVVIWKFVEVGAGIFCLAFIVERFITPTYCAFNTQYLDWKWFIKSYIKAYISGILFLIIGHYVLLHAWMNAWAEMLRFGDRLFYKDWWNCTTYREYYRTWNIVVHNWLYTYVYKDMYEIVVPGKRTLSSAMVFFISAIFHELVIAFSLRFFYPVLFILFGIIGYIFFFIRKYTSNVFMQLGLGFGMSIMFNLYSMEACARWNNCPSHPNYYLDLFIPRSWSCLK